MNTIWFERTFSPFYKSADTCAAKAEEFMLLNIAVNKPSVSYENSTFFLFRVNLCFPWVCMKRKHFWRRKPEGSVGLGRLLSYFLPTPLHQLLNNDYLYVNQIEWWYSWVSLYNNTVNLSGVNVSCIDSYAVLEWENEMKLHGFVTKHKAYRYHEHLI